MDRGQKEELVASMHQTFEDAAMVVVTHYSGLTVSELGELRSKMYEAGAKFKVTKNRLARLALKGTQYEALEEVFTGPTAIATSSDPVAPAKVAVEFANKNEKLTIVAGAMRDKLLSVEEVKALAKLPSLDELRGKLVGLLQAPATKIAGVLQAPAGQLARVLSARGSQEG